MKQSDLEKFTKIIDSYIENRTPEEKMMVKFLSLKYKLEDILFEIDKEIKELKK